MALFRDMSEPYPFIALFIAFTHGTMDMILDDMFRILVGNGLHTRLRVSIVSLHTGMHIALLLIVCTCCSSTETHLLM